jgi:hypothetical protein
VYKKQSEVKTGIKVCMILEEEMDNLVKIDERGKLRTKLT